MLKNRGTVHIFQKKRQPMNSDWQGHVAARAAFWTTDNGFLVEFLQWGLLGVFFDSSAEVLTLSSFHTTTEFMTRINAKIFFHVLPIRCVIS